MYLALIFDAMRSCWQEGQVTLGHRLHVPLALISYAMRSCWQQEQVTLVHRLHLPLALIFDAMFLPTRAHGIKN